MQGKLQRRISTKAKRARGRPVFWSIESVQVATRDMAGHQAGISQNAQNKEKQKFTRKSIRFGTKQMGKVGLSFGTEAGEPLGTNDRGVERGKADLNHCPSASLHGF